MAIRKSHVYLSLVNSYLIDSPQPSTLSYWYNLGSLLGLCLVIQIASGIFLAMHYSSHIELAFSSVEHIMRDVNYGYLIRYIHANGASFFFICMYLHIGKALYYGSYKAPRTLLWTIGVIIFIVTMATAFMGLIKHKHDNGPKSIINNNLGLTKSRSLYTNYNLRSNLYLSRDPQRIIRRSYYTSKSKDLTPCNEIFESIGIKPVNYWEDLHLQKTRSDIIRTVKDKSGIYLIVNKITRNFYVGSASTNRLHVRFANHLLNYHGSKLVERSVKKYGLDNFVYCILEYYPDIINKVNNKELMKLETEYISLLAPQYNILTEAGSSFGYKHTEENLIKIKSLFTDERRELLRQLQFSRKGNWSEKSKLKLREIALNRPEDYLTDSGRAKLVLNSSKTVYIYKDNVLICTFTNIKVAAHFLCCSYKTIQRSLNLGHIYIPQEFIPFLDNNHINNNNDIITHIDNRGNYKLKSGLVNKVGTAKYNIHNNDSS